MRLVVRCARYPWAFLFLRVGHMTAQEITDGPQRVREAWEWIVEWLRVNAPRSYGALRPGASESLLVEAEERLGFPLHADLRTLWAMNAGVTDDHMFAAHFLDGNGLLALDVALDTHEFLADAWSDWAAGWVPFTADEVTGPWSGSFVDCRTGRLGVWGMETEPEEEDGLDLAGWLELIVQALRDADGPLVGPGNAPGLAGGALVWLDPRDVHVEGWGPLHH
ncbi:hypothetical protein CGZ69_09815 [Streptomyces peucetius subsp. caesius ATCC 27952]|nr:hypothetical protein CGZ69_09815 [Streptomyces peucetius subsp. caesius ATCC 27952]